MTLKLHHHHPQFTLAAACSKTQVANQGKSGISFPALEILTFFLLLFKKKTEKTGAGVGILTHGEIEEEAKREHR